jgi:hypothetical protein
MAMLRIFGFFLFIFTLNAQTPDWVDNLGSSSKYPATRYLTGFGMSIMAKDINKADALEQAKGFARGDLAQKVKVVVQNKITSLLQETGDAVMEDYAKVVQSTSTIQLGGLELATWFDNAENTAYAFAYVRKLSVVEQYKKGVQENWQELQQLLADAKKLEQQKRGSEALDLYLKCQPVMASLAEKKAVLQSLGYWEPDLIPANQSEMRPFLQGKIQTLGNKNIEKIDDIPFVLSFMLKSQFDFSGKPLQIAPFNYRETKFSSPFGKYLNTRMKSRFSIDGAVVQDQSSTFILTGTYFDVGNQVKFDATIANPKTGKRYASATLSADKKAIEQAGLALKPKNFTQAYSDLKQFSKDEIVSGGLNVEVWTDKGSDNLIYSGGDIMKVYVRVNMPSYIRFIYHLADGQRVLLLDNYFIDMSKVNKVVEIPEEFECAPPFGAEVLQVNAATVAFPQVNVYSEFGYDFLADDLASVLSTTRGFRKKTNYMSNTGKSKKTRVLNGETRVNITTMR